MDGTRYSDFGARNDALRGAAARHRRDFAEDAHADFAQSRARRSRATQSASDRAAQSGIFSHEIGTNLNRATARTLPLVGKTFGRVAGQSRTGEDCSRGHRPRLTDGLV